MGQMGAVRGCFRPGGWVVCLHPTHLLGHRGCLGLKQGWGSLAEETSASLALWFLSHPFQCRSTAGQ